MKYRERFGLTPQEFSEIDLSDYLQDLEMMSIEAEVQEELNDLASSKNR